MRYALPANMQGDDKLKRWGETILQLVRESASGNPQVGRASSWGACDHRTFKPGAECERLANDDHQRPDTGGVGAGGFPLAHP